METRLLSARVEIADESLEMYFRRTTSLSHRPHALRRTVDSPAAVCALVCHPRDRSSAILPKSLPGWGDMISPVGQRAVI
jgi:hypothetical protein